MTDLQNPIFNDLDKAREALEMVRWPNGPFCPHCGNSDEEQIAKLAGKKQSHRPGLYYCNECKATFTVTVGTVFERSKIPLTKWWLATHLMSSSKKGVSAHQVFAPSYKRRQVGWCSEARYLWPCRTWRTCKDLPHSPRYRSGSA
jgi:transposase-like protein